MAMTRAAAAGALGMTVALLAPAPAWAQKPIPETVRMMEPHRLRIGDRVRGWSTERGPALEGTVVAVGDDTVTIATRNDAALLDLPSLHHLEVKRTRSHIRRAAAIGAAAGLLASFVLVTDELLGRELDTGERIAGTAGVVVAGAALGAGVGRLTRSVTWQPVDLITLKPRAADLRPALRLSWTVRF